MFCICFTDKGHVGAPNTHDNEMEIPEGPFDVEIVMETENQLEEKEDNKEKEQQEKEKEKVLIDIAEDDEKEAKGEERTEIDSSENNASTRDPEEHEASDKNIDGMEVLSENLVDETEIVETKVKSTPQRRSTRIRQLSETSNAASVDEVEGQASNISRSSRLVVFFQ